MNNDCLSVQPSIQPCSTHYRQRFDASPALFCRT